MKLHLLYNKDYKLNRPYKTINTKIGAKIKKPHIIKLLFLIIMLLTLGCSTESVSPTYHPSINSKVPDSILKELQVELDTLQSLGVTSLHKDLTSLHILQVRSCETKDNQKLYHHTSLPGNTSIFACMDYTKEKYRGTLLIQATKQDGKEIEILGLKSLY